MPLLFGCRDGSELLCEIDHQPFDRITLTSLKPCHLHLSGIDVLIDAEWKDIRESLVDISVSSDNLAKAGGSAQCFNAGSYFETKYETSPTVEFKFKERIRTPALKIHNRSTLWERADQIRVAIHSRDTATVIFESASARGVSKYLLERVLSVVSTLSFDAFSRETAALLVSVCRKLVVWGYDPQNEAVFRCIEGLATHFRNPVLTNLSDQQTLDSVCLALLSFYKTYKRPSEAFITTEFVLRSRVAGLKTAFDRIRTNEVGLINNRLYALINDALRDPSFERLHGHKVLLGHGVFDRARASVTTATALVAAERLQQLLTARGYTGFICYGALLGLVRDGRLLPHDDDIDYLVMLPPETDIAQAAEECATALRDAAYRVDMQSTNTPGLPFLTVRTPETACHLDIFFGVRQGRDVYLPMQRVTYGHVPFAVFGTGTDAYFEGACLKIPDDPDAFFEHRYGADWRIPDQLFRLREG